MNWNDMFGGAQMPTYEEIREYLGEAKPNWDELSAYIEEAYRTTPEIAYSKCSAQPGWNVKYKKNSKSLCTLYPMKDYFIALVVVGPKEEEEVRIGMEAAFFTPYVQELYDKTAYSAMGRWMMIEVKDKAILNDIKHLMAIRVRPKAAPAVDSHSNLK
jgi:hypothetical protein